jgi:predicted deacetylase
MPQLLLASIHDVSPRFESEIDRLLDLLHPYVGTRIAMLVVPNHWGDAPIVAGSTFARRLRAWSKDGLEIFLHGYFHQDRARHASAGDRLRSQWMTAGEGEFLGLTRSEAAARIAEGRDLLEDITGRSVAGFVAPAWLYGTGAHQALADCAIPLAEDHLRVWSPQTGARLAGGPVITWASRTRTRLASSILAAAALRHAPLKVMRIGVHPPDSSHPALMRSIERTFTVAMRHRRAGRYSDLLDAA